MMTLEKIPYLINGSHLCWIEWMISLMAAALALPCVDTRAMRNCVCVCVCECVYV